MVCRKSSRKAAFGLSSSIVQAVLLPLASLDFAMNPTMRVREFAPGNDTTQNRILLVSDFRRESMVDPRDNGIQGHPGRLRQRLSFSYFFFQ
jgi:hypothetical protein